MSSRDYSEETREMNRAALAPLAEAIRKREESRDAELADLRASLATERAAREEAESALAAMREAIHQALATGAEADLICSDCAQFVFRGILGEESTRTAPSAHVQPGVELRWMIYFEDAEVGPEILTDEDVARRRFQKLLESWSCHLFREVPEAAPLTPDEWATLNREREQLIDKNIAKTITPDEPVRLNDLQDAADRHLARFPRPEPSLTPAELAIKAKLDGLRDALDTLEDFTSSRSENHGL